MTDAQIAWQALRRWDALRNIVNTMILALGVPVWILFVVAGATWIAIAAWLVGFGAFYALEHATGRRLRHYLDVTQQPIPPALDTPYVMLPRQRVSPPWRI